MTSVNGFTCEETRIKSVPFTARKSKGQQLYIELDFEDLKKDTGVQTILDR